VDHNLPTRGPTRPPTHAAWVTYRPAIAPAASTSTPMSTPPGWARSSRCRPCTARPTDHGRCRLRADVLGFTRAGPRTDDAGRGLRAHPTGRAVTATWERLTSSSVITILRSPLTGLGCPGRHGHVPPGGDLQGRCGRRRPHTPGQQLLWVVGTAVIPRRFLETL